MGNRSLIAAGAYTRMSGRGQEKSPAEQRHEITKLAEREGCRIVAWFADDEITGDSSSDDRPGLAAMLDAAKAGKFKLVLAWHTNRLSREDPMDAIGFYNQLRRAGVDLHTCCEGRIDLADFAKQLLLFVGQRANHDFLRELAAKSLRGKISNAKKGGFNGGVVHYAMERALFDAAGNLVRRLGPGERVKMAGHQIRLVPGTDRAKLQAVRFAFERFDRADLSFRALADELDAKGFPAPNGGWTDAAVGRMLKTAAYIGTARWGAMACGKYSEAAGEEILTRNGSGKARPWRRKPPEDVLAVPGAYEGIIPPDLFGRVQAKLAARHGPRATPRRKAEFPLTGLMVCEHCGQPMHGETLKTVCNGKVYRYVNYVCSTYATYGINSPQNQTCNHFAVRSDRVQRWLVSKLQEVYLGPGRAELVEEIRRQLKADSKAVGRDVGRLEKRAADLDKEVGRLVRAIRTVDAAELVEELAIVRGERDRVKAELAQASKLATAGSLDDEAERVAEELLELGHHLTAADPALVREAFRQFVAKITCRWEIKRQGNRTRHELVRGEVHLRPQARPGGPDCLHGVQALTSPHRFPGRTAW